MREFDMVDHVTFDATTCSCEMIQSHRLPCVHVSDQYK